MTDRDAAEHSVYRALNEASHAPSLLRGAFVGIGEANAEAALRDLRAALGASTRATSAIREAIEDVTAFSRKGAK